jgi:pimeloyl-ACP methyl ester carboxylesterase
VTSKDGKKIWYDVVGSGAPLVLIGGSSLVSNQWEFMLPILKDHFRVILYDQRGAGRSDRPTSGITVEQWTDDLKLVLDDLDIDRTHIFGTSNGSFIVIRFAAKYPAPGIPRPAAKACVLIVMIWLRPLKPWLSGLTRQDQKLPSSSVHFFATAIN